MRDGFRSSPAASNIWISISQTLPFIAGDLGWMVGRGVQVFIGIDPIVGMLSDASLSEGLVRNLQLRELFVIKRVAKETKTLGLRWLTAQELHLSGDWALEWERYVTNIPMVGINLLDNSDCIVWCRNKKLGDVTTSLAYEVLA